MMLGWRYIKRVDASRAVYEVIGRRNHAGGEPTWLLRATDGSRREEPPAGSCDDQLSA